MTNSSAAKTPAQPSFSITPFPNADGTFCFLVALGPGRAFWATPGELLDYSLFNRTALLRLGEVFRKPACEDAPDERKANAIWCDEVSRMIGVTIQPPAAPSPGDC